MLYEVITDEQPVHRVPHLPAREKEMVTAAQPVQATPATAPDQAAVKLAVQNLTIRYGTTVALKDTSLEIREHEIFGIIGPANAGKTSFLKSLNRMDMFNSGMSYNFV